MSPKDTPEPPNQEPLSELDLPKLYRQAAWVAPLVGAVVVILVVTAQLVLRKDAQYAGNWINGIAALGQILNVLLTLYILLAAFGQLDHLRADLRSREEAHEQQAAQARADLERTLRQLDTQTEALALARNDAQQAQRETAMARLDGVAPRCSLELVSRGMRLHGNPAAPEGLVTDFPRLELDDHTHPIEVELRFRLRNWGSEPVTYSTTGNPWNSSVSGGVLGPNNEVTFVYKVGRDAQYWRGVLNGEYKIPSALEVSDNPTWVTLIVVVNSLSGEVTDTHTWSGEVRPIEEIGGRIVLREKDFVNAPAAGIRARNYAALSPTVGVGEALTE